MNDIKVILVPHYVEKEKLEEILNHKIDASVEAEYGNAVIEGDVYTLAHHTPKYENCTAPCNVPDIIPLKNNSVIIISHIDLDTLGGCFALMGIKPKDDVFWSAAEFIDTKGPQYLNTLNNEVANQIEAFSYLKSKENKEKETEITDVTEQILNWATIINKIINKDSELLENGRIFREGIKKDQESCLLKETKNIRVFIVPKEKQIFCNSAYFSFKNKRIKKCCIALNEKNKAITLSFSDGGKKLCAREIVQELWGEEAGGHRGIAGSPRGKEMSLEDIEDLIEKIEKIYQEKKDDTIMKTSKIIIGTSLCIAAVSGIYYLISKNKKKAKYFTLPKK